ncbi:MAG: dethiobiotin synthase [Planctomycetes bacterium]|nr:dethiobiotin synthase [Planctomycetota bacterium]
MRGLFFSGTDTSVGKTVVTAAVARLLRRQGRPVRVCKPVATGAAWSGGRWLSEDTWLLASAAGMEAELDRVTPWSFKAPAAPPVAARLAGMSLSLSELVTAVRTCAHPEAALLVEGVGSLLCPLTERETVADLVRELGLPLVLVARRSLGTLGHTLMAVEVATGRNLPLAGVVVSETVPPCGPADETNVDELRRRLAVPLLAVVPHGATGESAADAVAAVDWWQMSNVER